MKINTSSASMILLTAAMVIAVVFLLAVQSNSQAAPVESPQEGVDLDITYIERTPRYQAYCVEYPWDEPNLPGIPYLCPGTENEQRWPETGESVSFTAHIVNKGTSTSPMFTYAWKIDDTQVVSGSLPALAAGAETTVTYAWTWEHTMSADGQRVLDDHWVSFLVDPENLIAETYESNNSLTDLTNAKSFRIVITADMYDAYNTPVDPVYPYSTEDWLQKQIAAMNDLFAQAIYPTTPQGATDRVRLDLIEIGDEYGDDGRAHDGGWFIDVDLRYGASYYYDPAMDVDWGLVHELSHQVSLIDLYAIGASPTNVDPLDISGKPPNIGFAWEHPGLMGGGDISPYTEWYFYESHTAAGFETNKGYRNGYYGAYQFDIPEENWLLILDNQGNPAVDVSVKLFQRQGPWDWAGETGIDATAEISGTTDADGLFMLTNRSAGGGTTTQTGHTLRDNPFGVVDIIGTQNLFLVQLRRGDHEEFFWMDITQFNLAYWAGDTASHTFTIDSHIPVVDAVATPVISTFQVQGQNVHLCWKAVAQAAGYHVYRAGPPLFEYQIVNENPVESTCLDDSFDYSGYGGYLYLVTAIDAEGTESGYSRSAWTPYLLGPTGLAAVEDQSTNAVLPQAGDILLLDPQNGYAVTRIGPDGRYQNSLGSVHYHLEGSRFIAVDEDKHMLFSHPGDYYDPRHSVRLADSCLAPLLEFGQQGSDPGEFETPTGVAFWGPACTVEGPLEDDESTLLLLHLDGSLEGVDGEPGSAQGTEFTTGRYGQAISIDDTDTLTYTTSGNLDRTGGAIEFWLQPTWDGNDDENYVFFEAGDEWFNRLRIMKDGANNLRFLVWEHDDEASANTWIGDWQAGEWHHVTATWDEDEIAIYVDGLQKDKVTGYPPETLADVMYIGSTSMQDMQAQAIIEELRISNTWRVGNSDACQLFLAADSGNDRLQVFDNLGNFVLAYGSEGSEPGQFDDPQGLAVDDLGRVFVVDRGNNRIQVFTFNGDQFTPLQSVAAGFSEPVGIAVHDEQVYVADTGNNRIVVLAWDDEGNLSYLREYTTPNDGYSGELLQPEGVAVSEDGTIWVADTGNARVVRILAVRSIYIPITYKAE